MVNKVVYSAQSDAWATPVDFFRACDARYGPYTIDVAASAANAKCARYIDAAQDAMVTPWGASGDAAWCNPPYGRTITHWISRASDTINAEDGPDHITMLLPARTDTRWFWVATEMAAVVFVPGRLAFGDGKMPAPFPSMLVLFDRPDKVIRPRFSRWAWRDWDKSTEAPRL